MGDPCIVCHKTDKKNINLNDLPLILCTHCGLIHRATFDVPPAYYEVLDAGDTPEKRKIRFRNSIDRIKLFSRFVPRSGWCDVGTGEGIFLEALGGQGVGIEPSEESCKKAAQHGVKIVGHTIEDLSLIAKNNSVRTVSLFHVIEHLEHPDVEIRRIYDALPLGGFLIIETPNIDSPVFKLREYKDPLIYIEHLWYFSEKTLRALLEQSGFRIVASGGRDFDQYNLPIRESLFRLGFLPEDSFGKIATKDNSQNGSNDHPREEPVGESFVRVLMRRILSYLVIITGRLQYVWVVAEKSPK